RAATAAVLFLALVLATRREALLSLLGSRAARRTLMLFGVGLYLSQITYAISIEMTNAGTATVLQATCTVFVMLFTCLRARRLPRPTDFAGLVAALAAAALIATQGDWGVIVLPAAGLAWSIANALSETLYIMAPQRLYGRWDRVTIIGVGMVVSGVAAAIVWLAAAAASLSPAPGAASLVPELDAVGWLALIGGVGVLGTFAAFGLFLYGVSLVGSVRGSLLGVAEPVGAMVIAAVWLGTPFSAADWGGLVLMAAMIALVSLSGSREKR
ncbi:EamA family transporter, partial [Adlercreutzia caecimuris]